MPKKKISNIRATFTRLSFQKSNEARSKKKHLVNQPVFSSGSQVEGWVVACNGIDLSACEPCKCVMCELDWLDLVS